MDIYRNELSVVRHYPSVSGESVTAASPVQATVYNLAGDQVYTTEAMPVDDFYEAVITPGVSEDDTQFELVWDYDVDFRGNVYSVSIKESLFAGNAYARLSELASLPELASVTPFELSRMERLVAGVIDVFCNQTFNKESGVSYTIQGQDSDQLALPKPIIHLDDIEQLDDSIMQLPYSLKQYTTVDPDSPWILRRKHDRATSRKMSAVSRARFFRYPNLYRVTGDWGWDAVPNDVSRAATLLVKEYFCDDAKYREKYIANIRAGDWRMEFRVTGDETTGNANADTLLSGYRNVALAVI